MGESHVVTSHAAVNVPKFTGVTEGGGKWSWRRELNPRPSDYKSDALPTELRQPGYRQFHFIRNLRTDAVARIECVSPDEIVNQLQQIVSTLQQIVHASAELADRVAALEQQSGEKVGVLTSLQGHLQVLLESYQQQVAAQDLTNRSVLEGIGNLEARLNALESLGGANPPNAERPN